MTDLTPVLVIGLMVLYCVPMLVAGTRHHHQAMAIVALNLFLGWTLLGWVAALIWACSAIPVPARSVATTGART